MKSSKKVVFFSLLVALFISTSQVSADPENQEISGKTNLEPSKNLNTIKAEFDATKAELATTQRIVLQSIVETLWTLVKENQNTKIVVIKTKEKEYKLDLTEFGKTLSNLAIDEVILPPQQTIQQKVAELLTPTVVACLVTKIIPSIKEKKYLKISSDLENLGMQLLIKLLMVRLFLKPGTTKYCITNFIANIGSFYKYNPEKTGLWKYASLQHGLVKLTQDEIKVLIDTADINEKLNTTHRKKAIRKIIQALIEPYMEWLMDKACIHY